MGVFVLLVLAVTISHASDKNQSTKLPQRDSKNEATQSFSVINNETIPPNTTSTEAQSPHWYTQPEWWLFILGVPTLIFVWYQATLMERHAKHFESIASTAKDAVISTKDAVELSRDTAKKQLRAYFGTVAGKLYIYDDGTVEPRVTFINCGQTPAYDLQVIESGRFETPPFKKVPPPDQERLQSLPHVVGGGQPYYFTCRKIPYSQGKQQLLSDLSGPNYAFILNLWCTYRDIFKDSHPVNVQLIIGGGTALQRTIDGNGEWFGLFTDSEGNTYD